MFHNLAKAHCNNSTIRNMQKKKRMQICVIKISFTEPFFNVVSMNLFLFVIDIDTIYINYYLIPAKINIIRM